MRKINLGYDIDIVLERKFGPVIKSILGNQFIGQDVEADLHEGTDFLVFSVHPIKVAVRLRRHEYYLKYPNDFTIRWSRPSGVKTEIDKIREGLVQYLLYGFVDEIEKHIISYFIGDLYIFLLHNPSPISIKPNNPPDSQLAVFNLNQLPSSFILKRWHKGK